MALSDQQLLLIEQLNYINEYKEGISAKLQVDVNFSGSVRNVVEQLESVLDKMESLGTDYDHDHRIEGGEMAAIIRAIKADPELMSLNVMDYDSGVCAVRYESPSGEAYVAFSGTCGTAARWKDNALGLGMVETPVQEAALTYIDGLPYDNITVVGHSKGGNLAQYVTICSDKVNRCVSMDGQGFSKEFLAEYSSKIAEKGSCIKNYSVDTDYVHILLNYVPGAEQIYIAGDPEKAGARNHSPIAYFTYRWDEDGHCYLVKNGDTLKLDRVDENEGMTLLHEWTCFLANNIPLEAREKIGDYVGNIFTLLVANKDERHFTLWGKVYAEENAVEYILSDKECLLEVIAYTIKFANEYGLSTDQVIALLEAFGFKSLLDKIEEFARTLMITNPTLAIELGLTAATTAEILAWFLNLLKGEITDGMTDPIIEKFLRWINDNTDTNVDFVDLWRNIEKQYKAIGHVEIKTTSYKSSTGGTAIFDYSNAKYQQLMSVVRSVGLISYGSVSDWSQYSGEDWYPSLFIGRMATGISKYVEHMHEINENCAEQIEEIFEFVSTLDRQKAGQVNGICQTVKDLSSTLRDFY